jgi:IS5 family transposase
MRQLTLASQASFETFGRKGKRDLFLDQMEQVVPWSELLALVESHYSKAGNGRQPVGLAIKLRTYFLQQWFNLSDPGMQYPGIWTASACSGNECLACGGIFCAVVVKSAG